MKTPKFDGSVIYLVLMLANNLGEVMSHGVSASSYSGGHQFSATSAGGYHPGQAQHGSGLHQSNAGLQYGSPQVVHEKYSTGNHQSRSAAAAHSSAQQFSGVHTGQQFAGHQHARSVGHPPLQRTSSQLTTSSSSAVVSWRNGMITQIGGHCPDGSTAANREGWCLIRNRGTVRNYMTNHYGADVSGMTHSRGSTTVHLPTDQHLHGTTGLKNVIEKAVTVKGEKINVEVKGKRVTMIRGKCPAGSAPAVHGWCDIHDPHAVQMWFKNKYGLTVDLSAALGGTIDIRVVGNMISKIHGQCPPGTFPARAKRDFCVMSDRRVIERWLKQKYGISLNINTAVEKSAPTNQLNIEIEGDFITQVYNVCPGGSHAASERTGWCKVLDWVQVEHWLRSNYGVTFDMGKVKPIHKSFEVFNGLIDPLYGHCPSGSVRNGQKCKVVHEARLRQGIVEILDQYQRPRPLAKKMTIALPKSTIPRTG